MWTISEHTKTGIRMGLGVFITCGICYGVVLPQMKPGSKYSSAVFNAGKAASITTVVVNAPLMGRVTQVGLDRSVGTILGGLAGFLTVWVHYKFLHSPLEGKAQLGLMLSFAAFWAAWGSVEAGWRIAKLETTPRLFTLTFLLVAFGTSGGDIRGDFVTLVSRITGILSGVIVSLVLAVIVFPKSATQETLSRMKSAFESLLELSDAAWPKQLQDGDTHSSKHDEQEGVMYSTSSSRALKGLPIHLRVNRECEESLLSVFASLRRCTECGPLTRAEFYLGNVRGHLLFLPGLPMSWAICGGWSLDLHSLEGLGNSVSRVGRLIWALHLTFNEGISEHFSQILSQQYPRSLLLELQQSCQACLRDMMGAFSSTSKIVETGNLTRFTRAVEGLVRISDYHRREQLQCLREARWVRDGHPASVPEGDEEEQDTCSPSGEDQRPYQASHANGTRAESPSKAFWDLPQGLDIKVGPSQRALDRRATFRRQQSVEVRAGTTESPGSTHLTVKRVDPDDMLLFPETVDGMVAQVKWSSFLFLTEELVEGLQDAHVNLTNLIATLPCNNIKL